MTWVYLQAAQLAGHSLNPDFNGRRQNGVGFYTFTQRGGQRVTAEGAYLDPVRHRHNLTVIPNTQVTRVLFEGTTATGVAWRRGGATGVIEARRGDPGCGRLRLSAAADAVGNRQGPRTRPTWHPAGA